MNRVKRILPNMLRSFRFPRRAETRYWAWIVIVLLLFGVVATSNLVPLGASPTPSPSSTTHTTLTATSSTKTPAPATVDQNTETNGIIIGGVILVVIIVGGTLQALRPRSSD